jgi:hypothetical protein
MMHNHPPVYLSKQYWLDRINNYEEPYTNVYNPFEIIERLISRASPYDYEGANWYRTLRGWDGKVSQSCREKQQTMYNWLISDEEIIAALIKKDGYLICKLYSLSKTNNWIQNNLELFELAIENCREEEWQVKYILEISGSIVRENKDFMRKVIDKDGRYIQYASDAIRRNKYFVKLAMKTRGNRVFNHLSEQDILALLE